MRHLLKDGRNDEITPTHDDTHDEQHRNDDAEHTRLHVALVLDERNNRVEQVGDEPCHQKGDEHAAEPLNQQIGTNQDGDADEDAHHAVKSECLGLHCRKK